MTPRRRFGLLSAAVLLVVALIGAGGVYGYRALTDTVPTTYAFTAPRTLQPGPAGRILVADAGTGANDGRVYSVDPDDGEVKVLLDDLPSVIAEGLPFGDVAGPTSARYTVGNRLCVLIGGSAGMDAPFNTVQCHDGDLVTEYPITLGDAFDMAEDGSGGWYVTSPSSDRVIWLDAHGEDELLLDFVALFVGSAVLGDMKPPYVPLGVELTAEGELRVALRTGVVASATIASAGERDVRVDVRTTPVAEPIDTADAGGRMYVLRQGLAPDTGSIVTGETVIVSHLSRPASFLVLSGSRFAVSEPEQGRIRILKAEASPPSRSLPE